MTITYHGPDRRSLIVHQISFARACERLEEATLRRAIACGHIKAADDSWVDEEDLTHYIASRRACKAVARVFREPVTWTQPS